MTPTMLRHFWDLIETTQASWLLQMDDRSLVSWLLKQLHTQHLLDRDEALMLDDYIHSRLTLIRDLAHERLVLKA
jgi:hypothetical protein